MLLVNKFRLHLATLKHMKLECLLVSIDARVDALDRMFPAGSTVPTHYLDVMLELQAERAAVALRMKQLTLRKIKLYALVAIDQNFADFQRSRKERRKVK
jgi:hypothetical protein